MGYSKDSKGQTFTPRAVDGIKQGQQGANIYTESSGWDKATGNNQQKHAQATLQQQTLQRTTGKEQTRITKAHANTTTKLTSPTTS